MYIFCMENYMNMYEELLDKSNMCNDKAINFADKDVNLAIFYKNASKGFMDKALNMKIKDLI